MEKRFIKGILTSILLVSCSSSWAYWSSYKMLEWGSRNADTFYCLDIFDENWQMLKQAVVCGEGLHQYFPYDLTLPAGKYHWKVWSPSIAATYHEQQLGFEGAFEVPNYFFDERRIIWPNRGYDTFYCLDIFNFMPSEMVQQAVACGENLHSYSPAKLDLPVGDYYAIPWSPSVQNYPNYDETFSGHFETTSSPVSTDTLLQWNYRGEDEFYCLDIFDKNWNFLHQAVACGEGLHQFSPRNLNLAPGEYHWKVWSPSVQNYQEYQPKLEGSFTTEECGLPYRSDEYWVQWGCRNQDLLYCIDIVDDQGRAVAQPAVCSENLHQFSPRWLDHLGLSGTFHWRVWSPSVTAYDGSQPGFEGEFTIQSPKSIIPNANISWEVLRGHQLLDIYVDETGILWLGTTGGLEKWQLEPSQQLLAEWHWTSGGFPANGIHGIAPGANNSLWLATTQGLVNFHDGQVQTHFTPDNSPLVTQNVQEVVADGLGGVWIVTTNTSLTLSKASFMHFDGFGQWQTMPDIPQTILDKHGLANISALASDKQGGMWVGLKVQPCSHYCPPNGEGGILHYDGQGYWYSLNQERDDVYSNINVLATDQQGTLWIGFYHNQLAYFDGQNWEEISSTLLSDESGEVNLLNLNEKGIWLGLDSSRVIRHNSLEDIVHFDNQWRTFSVADPLPLPYAPNQIAGLGDRVWIGGGYTIEGKYYTILSYFDGHVWQNRHFASITDIAVETSTSNVWTALNALPMRRINQGTWEKLPYVIPNDSSSVTEILPTADDGFWVRTSNKIVRIDGHGNWLEVPIPESRPAYEFKLANDTLGGLWIGGTGKLAYYNPSLPSQEHTLPDNLLNETITYLYHDGKKVWIGMNYTLASFEEGHWQTFNVPNALDEAGYEFVYQSDQYSSVVQPNFLSIISDNADGIWMSIYPLGSLVHFDGQETWTYFNDNQRLPMKNLSSTIVTGLYADGYGQLWATSNNGLIRMRFE